MGIRWRMAGGLVVAGGLLLAGAAARALAEEPSLSAVSSGEPVLMGDLNSRLKISGSAYLFDYIPTLSVPSQDFFEAYGLFLNLDSVSQDNIYGFHAQLRLRDSKLRSFYLSNVWFGEIYAYARTPLGEVKVGKVVRKVGLSWDGSFFANLQYFNGLKLVPDYGAELMGNRPINRTMSLDYSFQYLNSNARTDGALPGRDVESDPHASLSDAYAVRLAPTCRMGEKSLSMGLSGFSGEINRLAGFGDPFRIRQAALDATLDLGPAAAYAEYLYQWGERDDAQHPFSHPGYDEGAYLLAGTHWQISSLIRLRVNYSQVRYIGQQAMEREWVPGVLVSLSRSLSFIAEYDDWRLFPDSGGEQVIDKSTNLVADYSF